MEELLVAWSVWLQGRSPAELPLWGHQVFWWARFGKVLELVAGLTVVLEIVGAQRLHPAFLARRELWCEWSEVADFEWVRPLPALARRRQAVLLHRANDVGSHGGGY